SELTLFTVILRPPPTSTLFPYTTLFRSLANPIIISADTGRAAAFAKYDAPRTIPALKAVLALATHLSDNNRLVPQQKSPAMRRRSEEHTSELQSPYDLVCRLLLEKKKRD